MDSMITTRTGIFSTIVQKYTARLPIKDVLSFMSTGQEVEDLYIDQEAIIDEIASDRKVH